MSKVNWLVLGFIVTCTCFGSKGFSATLPQVTGLAIDGDILSWTPQEGAEGYNIHLDYLYHDTVRGSESFTLTEPGLYHVISFNDNGEFGITLDPDGDNIDYSVFYEGSQHSVGFCETHAEDIGPLILPYSREDYLGVDPVESSVDFYRFDAEAGTELIANLRGSASGYGDLEDPLMGLLDSDCQIIDMSDDFYNLDSFFRFTVPDDGVFLIAVSRYGDYEFNGSSQTSGGSTYTLTLDAAPPVIDSITARLINRFNSSPLPGDKEPYAGADLYRCNTDCDQLVAFNYADGDGVVKFDSVFIENLTAGTYLLRAFANDFESTESGRFSVSDESQVNVGDIPMSPPPISFGDFTACENLPPQGGRCTYEIQVDNFTNSAISSLVWSEVEASGLASSLGYSSFEASAIDSTEEFPQRSRVEVPAQSSAAVSFSFDVPSLVSIGAQFCQSVLLGAYPDPLFNTLKQTYLFCIIKNSNGYERLIDTQMAKVSASYSDKSIKEQRRSRGLPVSELQ